MRRLAQRADAIIAFAIMLASFLLYLRTLAPDVVDADGGEFQFAAWNFGFVHPTGYPLYLILGGLFQHLVPIGNPAYRLNLFTAITAALAVAMVYLVVNEITRHRGAAMIAAAAFAVTRTFWYDAGAAETYALNAFFVALLIYIALRWQSDPTAKKFAVFCLAGGLALTHHRAIVLWLPAFGVFFWGSGFKFHPFDFAQGMVLRFTFHVSRFALHFFLLAFPFLLYLYVPLRAPTTPYATLALAPGRALILYDNSITGLINYLLGRTFQSEIGWDAVSAARWVAFPQLLLDQFGAVGVALGVIGFVAMARRKREWARLALLLTGFAVTILFASVYHIGDIVHYYIPAYLVWAGWIGCGVKVGLDAIRNSKFVIQNSNAKLRVANLEFRILNVEFAVLTALAIVLIIPQLIINLPFADRTGETRVREQWTRVLAAPIPPSAILISNDRDEMMPLWYIQYVENTRRDVLGLFPLITPAPAHANIARLTDSVLDAGRPVFFVKPMPGIEIKYRVESSDTLVRVLGSAADARPQNTTDATMGHRVRVIGYDVTREPDALRVVIYWQPIVKLDANYTTFVHLLDLRGNKMAQGNDHPVGGVFYPTSLWDIGETLRDEFVISLPPNLARGTYQLLVGMYRPPDAEMLGEPVVIGTVEIH